MRLTYLLSSVLITSNGIKPINPYSADILYLCDTLFLINITFKKEKGLEILSQIPTFIQIALEKEENKIFSNSLILNF